MSTEMQVWFQANGSLLCLHSSAGIYYERAVQGGWCTAVWESRSVFLLWNVWSEDQHQPCYKSIPDLLSLRGVQVKDITSCLSGPLSMCHLDIRMVLSAQVCGLISSHSAGDSGFSPRPSASAANFPSSVTSYVLKALNIIYMVSPLPSISPVKSCHLNPRLVNTTQFPRP